MASGSCPVVPVADESFLTDAAAMDMEDTGTNKYQKLVKSGIGSIIYSHSATDIPVHLSPGKYILKSVDPKTGAITVIAKRLNIKDVYMLKAEKTKIVFIGFIEFSTWKENRIYFGSPFNENL